MNFAMPAAAPSIMPAAPSARRWRAPRRARAATGFTLLEVLIAVSLLALMTAMAVGSLRGAISATRSGERLISASNQTRTVQEFLRRQLSHAMHIPFRREEDMSRNQVFVADRHELRFVAPMPGHLSNGGPHVQWITIADDELLFDHAQLNGYDPDDPKAGNPREPVLLMRGFAEAYFEYRGLDENGELGGWMRDWDSHIQIPLLIRLVLRYEDEARSWPDLEIPILAGSTVPVVFQRNRPAQRSSPGGRESLQ